MRKVRFFAVLLCFLMVALAMPFEAYAWELSNEGNCWQLNEDGMEPASAWENADYGMMRDLDPNKAVRIAGKNRFETSIMVAEIARPVLGGKFDSVILVSGMDFPDALGAGGPAYMMGAPIILVDKNDVMKTAEYVGENLRSDGETGYVYIMGGKGAVPETMETALASKGVDTDKIYRMAGSGRYETNIEVLKGYSSIGSLLVCSGKDFADALSASALGMPILLVGDKLTDSQRDLIADYEIQYFSLIGGNAAVSEEIENELKAIEGAHVQRISGKNRFETSRALAESRWGSTGCRTAVLSYGLNFPDGLSGAVLCHMAGAPMLLATSSQIGAAAECAHGLGVQGVLVMGGPTLISDDAAMSLVQ